MEANLIWSLWENLNVNLEIQSRYDRIVQMHLIKNMLLNGIVLFSTSTFAAELTVLNNTFSPDINSMLRGDMGNISLNTQVGDILIPFAQNKVTLSDGNINHKRYQQFFNGLPVFGYHVIAHEKEGEPTVYSGMLVKGIETDISSIPKAAINPEPIFRAKKNSYAQVHPQAVIKEYANSYQSIIFVDERNKAHRAYHITFLAVDATNHLIERPHWIIDATTNEQLKFWNGLSKIGSANVVMPILHYTSRGEAPGGNEKMGFYQYGKKGLPFLKFAYESFYDTTVCHLNNQRVKIMDYQNHYGWDDDEGVMPKQISWNCDPSKPVFAGDPVNGAASPSADALAFGTYILEAYETMWGISPIESQKLVINIHVGTFPGAFWDGFAVNLSDGGSYSDDDVQAYYPFTSMDIIAHEIAHALTENTSALIYAGQSGGLNESFSDIMGKFFQIQFNQRYFPKKPVEWMMGYDVAKNEESITRYLEKPSRDGKSIEHISSYYEDLDPHYSSGLFNRLFYLIANDERLEFNIQSAAELFLYANMNYWYPSVNFEIAAFGLMQTADEFENSPSNYAQVPYVEIVKEALAKIGIDCLDRAWCDAV